MANDKKFVTKNGLQTQNINFVDLNSNNTITVSMLTDDVLSFSGNTGQLFSISDDMTGTIFSVNDISGIPSIEVLDTGEIILDGTVSGTVLASQAEAEAGTATNKLMTPLLTRNAFNAAGSAPVYACRAWVNFNGTGTVAITSSGNVTSITDNGTGDYTVNFTTAMEDANYSIVTSSNNTGVVGENSANVLRTTTQVRLRIVGSGGTTNRDCSQVNVAIFR